MIQIGDKVKFNIEELERCWWADLSPAENTSNKDYKNYILENPDKVYTVDRIAENCSGCPYQLNDDFLKENCSGCPYQLNDDFLKKTSFALSELIKVE